MKKLLTIGILISYLHNAQCQKYHPMLSEGKTWVTYFTSCISKCVSSGPVQYSISGDSIIDSKMYKIVWYQYFNTDNSESIQCMLYDRYLSPIKEIYGFLREDTVLKRVYELLPEYCSKEILSYDFSLQQGDSFKISGFHDTSYCQLGKSMRIDIVKITTLFDGTMVKSFYNNYESIQFIEGVGSEQGPFHMLEVFESATRLLYMKENDNIMYSYCMQGLQVNLKAENIKIYPNPCSQILNIENTNEEINSISIYNMQGQVIENKCKKRSESRFEFNVSDYKQGIYIIEVHGKSTFHYKIIKQ